MNKTGLFAQFEPIHHKRLLTYAITYFSVGVGVSLLGPILPFLAGQVSVSLGQISFAFTAQNLGYLLGSVGGGWLYDRFPSHRLMVFSLCLMAVSGLVIPLVPWFYALLLILFFFGLGLGVMDVGENLVLVWMFKSRVGPYLNALHFIFGTGAFFTPIIITAVMGWTGGSLSWAMWALVLLFCPGLIGLTTLTSPREDPTEVAEGGVSQHYTGLILLLILLFFMAVGVQIGFSGWIFTYVSELSIADITAASLMTSLFWGTLTLGRLVAVPISRKVRPGSLVLFNCAILVVVMGLILVWPQSPAMMWAGSAGMGLGTSLIFPTLLAFAKTRLPMSGRVTGLFFLGSSLGMMVVPMLLGQVFDRLGGYAMMLVLFAAVLIGLVIMVVLNSKRFSVKQRLQDI